MTTQQLSQGLAESASLGSSDSAVPPNSTVTAQPSPASNPSSGPQATSLRRAHVYDDEPSYGVYPKELAGAGVRFIARSIDMLLGYFFVGLILQFTLAKYSPAYVKLISSIEQSSSLLVGVILLPLVMLLEATVASVFGNTPGKALVGVRVRRLDGAQMRYIDWIARCTRVWVSGLALGFPLVNMIVGWRQSKRVGLLQPTTYDESLQIAVMAMPMSGVRRVFVGFACITAFAAYVGLDAMTKISNEEARKVLASPPYSWQNPVTGVSTTVDAEWTHKTNPDPSGNDVQTFTDHTQRALVIMGVESGPLSLNEYAKLLVQAINGPFVFSDGGAYTQGETGVPTWRVQGVFEQNGAKARVLLEVRHVNDEFWRIMTIDQEPHAVTQAKTAALAAGLWGTTPRPGLRTVPAGMAKVKPQS